MEKKPDNSKPYPLRIGEIKPQLQQIAQEQNRSLGNLIKTVLKEYIKLYNLQ